MEELNDLSLRCNFCKTYFPLSSVLEHRKHHRAMRIMRFKEGKGPRNIDSLSKRHMMLLRKVLEKFKDNHSDPNLKKRLERMEDAYETLRFEFTKDESRLKSMLTKDGMTSMRDGYFEPRDRVEDDDVTSKPILSSPQYGFPESIYGIGHSEATNIDWRDEMEDRTTIKSALPSFSSNEIGHTCYIGMFDGYHGSTAAQTSSEHMHRIIIEEISAQRNQVPNNGSGDANYSQGETTFISEDDDTTDNICHSRILSDAEIGKCLTKSFYKMDGYLGYGINEKSRLRWSGCSALTCLISEENSGNIDEKGDGSQSGSSKRNTNESDNGSRKNSKYGKIFISNAGNVQAILYQKKKPYKLSQLDNLNNEKEKERVVKMGGTINSSEKHARINGVMETTRGLGNHGDPSIRTCMIATPHTAVTRITKDAQMLVIATNSLWDVLNQNDVFSILLHSIPSDISTALSPGPTPIIPVIHGHYRSGRKGADLSDTHQTSTLPSIVETEEEQEIEEVIFVKAQDSDSDDEKVGEDLATARTNGSIGKIQSSASSLIVQQSTDDENIQHSGNISMFSGDDNHSAGGDYDPRKDENVMIERYANVASLLSERLVRAAILAGAVDNVSAVVVLFKGMFNN
uniref:protein phosphatase 2C-like domain-containing protein 1 n=1 Tax=Styela clava TaxID=7725 RepID=UPI001939E6CD|nr:protein phosphatase 2C-like domain-containing protein 1 [Styela clava]